jgi:4-amino-4-deoxy-L-arabinose transferase-like glycosyltransferase
MKKFVLILIFLALVSGFVWGSRNQYSEPTGDGVGYDSSAQSLITHRSYSDESGQLTARRDPGYPFFLAGIYGIFGVHYKLVKMIQLLLFVLICLVVYYLTREIFGQELIARIAAILTALYYPLALSIGFFYTEILFTLLLLLSVYFYLKSWKADSVRLAVLAGILFGLAALTRSVVFYFPFFFFVVSLLFNLANWKKVLLSSGVFLLAFSIIVAPWMIRNYYHFGKATISIQSGSVLFFATQRMKVSNQDLLKMYTANILGDYFAVKLYGGYDRIKIEEGNFGETYESLAKQGLTQDEIDKKVGAMATADIKANPLRYLLIVPPIEFLKLITPIFPFETAQGLFSDPTRYSNVPDFLKAVIVLTVRLVYWLFLGLLLFGLIRSREYWRELLLIFSLLAYFIAVYSLLHGVPRYLIPIMPLGLIFFSSGILSLFKKQLTLL